MRYDLAVIGAGPAGLSAALNASIRNKNVILFGLDSASVSKSCLLYTSPSPRDRG